MKFSLRDLFEFAGFVCTLCLALGGGAFVLVFSIIAAVECGRWLFGF